MTRRQCRPVRLDQYVKQDPRLIFETRLVFEEKNTVIVMKSEFICRISGTAVELPDTHGGDMTDTY